MTTTIEATDEVGRYKSMQQAADELGVSRHSIGYYAETLSLTLHKFPFDQNKYLALKDFEHIKALREDAESRGRKQRRARRSKP